MGSTADKTPESLAALVFKDDLTGLFNRRYLFRWLKSEVKWEEASPKPLSLLMLDLDDFKKINDQRGHLAGDDAIRHFAKTFVSELRPNDVGVRYAGDEFAILLPGTAKEKAAEIGRAFLARLASSPWPPDASRPLLLKASAGLATFPEDGRSPEELVERADEALLHSKRSGKNVLSVQGQIDAQHLCEIRALEGIPCPRFVGRDRELTAMEGAVQAVAGGRATLMDITGLPGTGKTRLLGETIRRARDLGWTCLLERCSEYESMLPLQPLIALIEQYARTRPEEAVRVSRELPVDGLGVLSEHVRVLDAPPDAVTRARSLPEPTRRKYFFQALAQYLASLAKQRPLLVALDEFQFIDAGSLAVLRQLVTSKSPILVAAARRCVPGEELSPELFRLRNGLDDALCAIELRPLDSEAFVEFLRALLPGAEDVSTLTSLIEPICQGNPLFVEECLKFLILRGVLRRTLNGWAVDSIQKRDLPPSLDEVIWSRLTTLDPETSRIIAGAAVIGPNFALDVLQGLSGKNQGETQELIDRAEKARIIAPDGEGEMRFVSARLQEVSYDHVPTADRRDLHGQVAQIEEKKGATPARLAHHFERGAMFEKAREYAEKRDEMARKRFSVDEAKDYTRRTKMLRRQRVKEATHALDHEGQVAAANLLRCLTLAVKSRKMYPAGSQVVVSSRKSFLNVATDVLSRTESITVSVDKGVLLLNSQPADVKTFGAVAQESIALLEERMIRGMTLTRDGSTEELEKFLDLLSDVKPEESLDPFFWEDALDSRAIAHLALHPRAYVATDDSATDVKVEEAVGASVRETLRALIAAVDNARMYPPGSQIIGATLEQLWRCLADALGRAPEVTLGEVDGALVVNGIAGTARTLGTTAASALRMLVDRNLKSCSLRRGITADELGRFVEVLASAGTRVRDVPWQERLGEHGVTHVQVGEAKYALDRGAKAPAPPPPRPPLPEQAAADAARTWLQGAPADLVVEPRSRQVPPTVERLALDGEKGLVGDLGAFLARAASAPAEETRRAAYRVLAACWERVKTVAPSDWIAAVEPPLSAATRTEKLATVLDAMADAVLPLLEDRAAARDYIAARKLLWALGATGEGSTLRARPGLDRRLREIAEKTIGPALLSDLVANDSQVRLDALSYVTGLGRSAALAVAKAIGDTTERAVRETLGRLLKGWGKEAVDVLREELSPFQDAMRAARIAEVLDQWSLSPAQDLGLALGHRDPSVWAAALVAARKVPRKDAADALIRALSAGNPAAAAGAARAIGELRLEEATTALRQALERWTEPFVLQEVCLALGKLHDPEAAARLIALATRKGFLFFSKGLPDELRAAAAWALCEIGTVEAQDALKHLLKDASLAVRSAIHERRS